MVAFKGNSFGRHGAVLESGGFTLAEGASAVVSLGVVGVADKLIPAPLLKEVTQGVAKVCVLPFLDKIEWGLSKVCKLEECKVDKNQSREERAERLARVIVIFGGAWAASMVAKGFARRQFNSHMGIVDEEAVKTGNWIMDNVVYKITKPNELKLFAIDEGVHYGSLFLMNTAFAKETDKMIDTVSDILEKRGVSKQKANELATMAVVWEGSNLLGFASGIGNILHRHSTGRTGMTLTPEAEKIIGSLVTPAGSGLAKA